MSNSTLVVSALQGLVEWNNEFHEDICRELSRIKGDPAITVGLKLFNLGDNLQVEEYHGSAKVFNEDGDELHFIIDSTGNLIEVVHLG